MDYLAVNRAQHGTFHEIAASLSRLYAIKAYFMDVWA
jgi:hypothetical protein